MLDGTPEVKTDDQADSPAEETDPTLPDSSPEETEGTEPEGDEPEEEEPAEPELPVPVTTEIPTDGTIKRLADESDREYAFRLEIKRLRDKESTQRGREILEKPEATPPAKIESEILKKYKAEEIQSLREVLPELAKELGYVKKDDLAASSYEEKAQEQIDAFISSHPEYSPEKDPDSILWNKLKSEYNSVYKPPSNPRDFKKIFERIHNDIFGIQATGSLPKIVAAKEKVNVASHAGASAPNRLNRSPSNSTGIRFDALKGFSDEEISSMQAGLEE